MYRYSIIKNSTLILNVNRSFSTSNLILAPKSPMQVFAETFSREWKKSTELTDQIKQLKSATDELGDSEAFKRAKIAYETAQKGSGKISKSVQKTAEVVGDVAQKAWESPVGKVVKKTAETTAEVVDKVVEPVTKTKTYKDVSEVFNENSSSYGLYESKEDRLKRREKELLKKPKLIKKNDDAGNSLVITDIKPTSSFKENLKIKPNSSIGKFFLILREKWEEAENPLLVLIRTIFNKIGSLFAETEAAKVVKQFREIDPNFTSFAFQKQLREYIVPEVVEAYIQGDEETLKNWLSEAPFNIYAAKQKQLRDQGIFSDGKILDIRGVDIVTYKMLEPNNIPVMVIGARVQEINLFRKFKTGELVAGSEEDILLSSYAMVVTRIPEEMDNKVTEGWKVLEFVRGGSRTFT
ncbi:protein translocase subunit [Pichia californica]|uniref:Mitochondrial import inner membrane translocase subunit TIM44 n=1 Tax=Pichia californica TaxID=460514 RepID=A0A9P6WJA2_9ASCO|nr:protein translocase subunit [[Candida] californica]KAG0687088.1 protein translocase subunit [[Candida] californica]